MSQAEMETLAEFLKEHHKTIMDALHEAWEMRDSAAKAQASQYPGDAQVDADKSVDYAVCRQSLGALIGEEWRAEDVNRVA